MKKLLSLILAGSMLFSLAACGGSSENKDDDNNKKNSSDIVENNGDVVADEGGVKIDDCITFGEYEQDNDTSNGKEPIEWLVLDKQGNKVLVISKYALDCKPYNEEWTEVTWETCSIRSWLNNEFINVAFIEDEKAKINTTLIAAEDNIYLGTDAGNDTRDKIFLLSISEAETFFGSDKARECEPTDYAKAQGITHASNCVWWLRVPGYRQDSAAAIDGDGSVYKGGDIVSFLSDAVRPAMWIEL